MAKLMDLNPDFKEFVQLLNAHNVRYLVGEVTVNLIDFENLKRSKRASGRPQDLADLANLE